MFLRSKSIAGGKNLWKGEIDGKFWHVINWSHGSIHENETQQPD